MSQTALTHDLFKRIEAIVPALQGWCTVNKAIALASSVVALHPKVSVEIGIFGGRSFLPIAMAHKEINFGVAWGIDPWDRQVAVDTQTDDESRQWWDKLDLEVIREGFLAQVHATGVSHCIEIHRRRSREVVPPPVIDLLHVDGAHNDEAVEDVNRWASHVRVGGLCFCDDLNWVGDGVQRAVERLIRIGFRELYYMETGAMFQRVKE